MKEKYHHMTLIIVLSVFFVLFNFISVHAQTVKETPKDLDGVGENSKFVIDNLFERGLLDGYSDGTFKPLKDITRAEFAAMIVRALDLKATENNTFGDSKKGDWYYDSLNIMYQQGLMKGKIIKNGNLYMAPDDKITRTEMIIILNRAYGLVDAAKGNMPSTNDEQFIEDALKIYEDNGDIPKWARKDIGLAVINGITTGLTKTKLGVLENGSRLQSALFTYRLLSYKETEKRYICSDGTTIINNLANCP